MIATELLARISVFTNIDICPLTFHRLVFTSLMLAHMWHEEKSFTNTYYCRVGGVVPKEGTRLMVFFLQSLNHRIHVSKECFFYRKNLMNQYFSWIFSLPWHFVEQAQSEDSSEDHSKCTSVVTDATVTPMEVDYCHAAQLTSECGVAH